ncbi:ribonuclease H-like domain-containing protein [Tanacetum coccineum]|uniref:Ribonuclease H-like domain-containing protein n=1 Tax=Tanacetum coccineum TaxID=301880 RepID=A0ABQ5D5B6_9ASTR
MAEGSSAPPPDDDWLATNKIIKSWIYLTISEPLFKRVVKAKPRTSKDTWDVLEKIFHDNKRSKTVKLMGELCDLDMGDLTVDSYFCKIDSIAAQLGNLGSNMSEEDIVQSRMNRKARGHSSTRITSSSPTVLLAPSSSRPQVRTLGLTTLKLSVAIFLVATVRMEKGHKYFADGSLSRYKALLVANGRSQQVGVDCDETFSLVVKLATIRTVLSLAASRHWHVHQLEVKNAFLHAVSLWSQAGPKGLVLEICQLCYAGWILPQSHIISSLHKEFSMSDLGPLNYFLGISVTRDSSGMFLSQHHLLGVLQYLTFTRPDLSYAVQQVCLYMHDPQEPHLTTLKRILRYVRGTTTYGVYIYASSSLSLVGYPDADWAGCPTTRLSTSGYYVFLGINLISWSSKRQVTLSRSSAEAEYRGVANVVVETAWICNLLQELHSPLSMATLVYCDNVSSVYLSSNPVQHQRTKHIKIDIHFVRDQVVAGRVRVLHVPSRYQFADIFTKGLPYVLFDDFRTSLSCNTPKSGLQRNVEYPRALLHRSMTQDMRTTTKRVI